MCIRTHPVTLTIQLLRLRENVSASVSVSGLPRRRLVTAPPCSISPGPVIDGQGQDEKGPKEACLSTPPAANCCCESDGPLSACAMRRSLYPRASQNSLQRQRLGGGGTLAPPSGRLSCRRPHSLGSNFLGSSACALSSPLAVGAPSLRGWCFWNVWRACRCRWGLLYGKETNTQRRTGGEK